MSGVLYCLFMKDTRRVLPVLLLCLASCARNHTEQRAAAEVDTIKGAVLSFRSQYGYNPVITNNQNSTDAAVVLPVLLALPDNPVVAKLNPDHIRFLNVPSNGLKNGMFLDPWGKPYHIVIAGVGGLDTKVGKQIVHSPVAVWSDGKDGIDEEGNGDDICSWK